MYQQTMEKEIPCSQLSLSNKSNSFKCEDHAFNILNKLQDFYEKKEFFDIVLIAGIDNVKLQAHRIVLCASSEYFLAMFKSTLNEAEAKEITLENVNGQTLKLILDFLYTASIELQSNTVEDILSAADFFQIYTLIDACCDLMGEQLDVSNCLGITLFAEQHGYRMLYEKSIVLAYDSFEKLYLEKEFLKLSTQQLGKFLFSEDLCEASQEHVFNSIIKWVEHGKANREKFLLGFLSHVRYTTLMPKFIIENSKPMCKSIECYELMRKWLEWHLSPESRLTISTNRPEESPTTNKLCYATGTEDLEVQTFNPELNKWVSEEWTRPNKIRVDYSMAVVNGKLIIAGGRVCGRITNTVEYIDLQTKKWSELPPMKLARCWPGLAELNGHLYVVGSEINGKWSSSVEVFDFSLQAWIYLEPLREAVSDIQVAVLNELLYVGGNDKYSLECYNPGSFKWTTTACKATSLCRGLAAVNGCLYAIGGDCTDCYEPLTNSWTVAKSLGSSASPRVKCVAFNNQLIVYDGYTIIEEYDPKTDEWMALAPLLQQDFRISSCLFTM